MRWLKRRWKALHSQSCLYIWRCIWALSWYYGKYKKSWFSEAYTDSGTSSILMTLYLKLKRKVHLSICCFMLVPGMANHTPRNWSYWYSTDWYWEDISIRNAWIHSLDFTTNVRTAHMSDLFSCGYFPPPSMWWFSSKEDNKLKKKNYKLGGISTKLVEQYKNIQCQMWWTLPSLIYLQSKDALLQIQRSAWGARNVSPCSHSRTGASSRGRVFEVHIQRN